VVSGLGPGGEGFGGLDHTMGRQNTQPYDDECAVTDTGEAGAGNGDGYGTSPVSG
jgi:hypothetical protein